MYLHPQTVLHPQTSDSYFQSQLFASYVEELDGSGAGSVVSLLSDKFKLVMPGNEPIGGGESKCGDNERIRGKSISIILKFS